MKLKIITVVSVIIALYGCRENKPANHQELEIRKDSTTDSLIVDRIILPNDSGVIFLDLSDGGIKEKIRKETDQIIFLEFNINDTATVFGYLSSKDSLANIHFYQIHIPGGTIDGPFGRELKYSLKHKGKYRIAVYENKTAGNPWGGVFMLRLALLE